MDLIIVVAIVLVALFFTIRGIVKNFNDDQVCGCDSGCSCASGDSCDQDPGHFKKL